MFLSWNRSSAPKRGKRKKKIQNTDLIRNFPTWLNSAATLRNEERDYAFGYEYIRKGTIF